MSGKIMRILCLSLLIIAAAFGIWGWFSETNPQSGSAAVMNILAIGLFAYERFSKREDDVVPFLGFQRIDSLRHFSASQADNEELYLTQFEVSNHGTPVSDITVTSLSGIRITFYSPSSVLAEGVAGRLDFHDHPAAGSAKFALERRTRNKIVTTQWVFAYESGKIKPA